LQALHKKPPDNQTLLTETELPILLIDG